MRRTELDLCRIIGCLMVLVIHASSNIFYHVQMETWDFAFLSLAGTSVRAGVPIFFMLTGALVLGRERLDIKALLKKHVLHLGFLFLAWSFAYTAIRAALSGDIGSAYDFLYSVVSGHYHMWFIPTMMFCYIFIPPTHAAIHGQKLGEKYLLGLLFGLVLLMANMNLTPDTSPILYRITQHFSYLCLPYMGYVVWGWWLSTRKMPKWMLWAAPLGYVLCVIATTGANLWYSFYKMTPDGWLFNYFSLPNFIQATAIFCFCLSLKEHQFRHARLITALADCTLGVYLIHPMMIALFEKLGFAISSEAPVQTLVLLTAALAVSCFAISFAAKRIPLVKKLF